MYCIIYYRNWGEKYLEIFRTKAFGAASNSNNSEVDRTSERNGSDCGTRDVILFEGPPVIKELDSLLERAVTRIDGTRSSLLINCVIIKLTILPVTTGPTRFERLYNLTESLSERTRLWRSISRGPEVAIAIQRPFSLFPLPRWRCVAPRCNQF